MRAYMHGYFMHQRLWQRARSLAQPLEPAALRQQRIAARLDAERASRITLVKKLPKVRIWHMTLAVLAGAGVSFLAG